MKTDAMIALANEVRVRQLALPMAQDVLEWQCETCMYDWHNRGAAQCEGCRVWAALVPIMEMLEGAR